MEFSEFKKANFPFRGLRRTISHSMQLRMRTEFTTPKMLFQRAEHQLLVESRPGTSRHVCDRGDLQTGCRDTPDTQEQVHQKDIDKSLAALAASCGLGEIATSSQRKLGNRI